MFLDYGTHTNDDDGVRRIHSIRGLSDEELEIIATALHISTNVLITRLPNKQRARAMSDTFAQYMVSNEIGLQRKVTTT